MNLATESSAGASLRNTTAVAGSPTCDSATSRASPGNELGNLLWAPRGRSANTSQHEERPIVRLLTDLDQLVLKPVMADKVPAHGSVH